MATSKLACLFSQPRVRSAFSFDSSVLIHENAYDLRSHYCLAVSETGFGVPTVHACKLECRQSVRNPVIKWRLSLGRREEPHCHCTELPILPVLTPLNYSSLQITSCFVCPHTFELLLPPDNSYFVCPHTFELLLPPDLRAAAAAAASMLALSSARSEIIRSTCLLKRPSWIMICTCVR